MCVYIRASNKNYYRLSSEWYQVNNKREWEQCAEPMCAKHVNTQLFEVHISSGIVNGNKIVNFIFIAETFSLKFDFENTFLQFIDGQVFFNEKWVKLHLSGRFHSLDIKNELITLLRFDCKRKTSRIKHFFMFTAKTCSFHKRFMIALKNDLKIN